MGNFPLLKYHGLHLQCTMMEMKNLENFDHSDSVLKCCGLPPHNDDPGWLGDKSQAGVVRKHRCGKFPI